MKPRLHVVAVTALAAFCLSACGPGRSTAQSATSAVPTSAEGEIEGTLTALGGPGSSPQPVQGTVDVYTFGGKQVSDTSAVSGWHFELKPGAYSVRATANGQACQPAVVKVVKDTIEDVNLACPSE